MPRRFANTCTKFAAWNLTKFDRVIFMDADMIAVGPVDDAARRLARRGDGGGADETFAAAPETLPPDQFNSGAWPSRCHRDARAACSLSLSLSVSRPFVSRARRPVRATPRRAACGGGCRGDAIST